jgi:hypothetical protein
MRNKQNDKKPKSQHAIIGPPSSGRKSGARPGKRQFTPEQRTKQTVDKKEGTE